MARPHVTIAQMMALVLFVGFGFAALRHPNDFWASATFTLAIVVISAATVGAIARKGSARITWAGFAVFGWACLIIWLSRPQISPGVGMGGGGFGGGFGQQSLPMASNVGNDEFFR